MSTHKLVNNCSVKFSSVAQLCPTLCDPMDCSTPGFPIHHQLPEFIQTHVHQVSDAIQPSHFCHPLLLPPSIFPSIRVFSNESVLCIWSKYWSFSFSISPHNESSGLISFKTNWFDLLYLEYKRAISKPNAQDLRPCPFTSSLTAVPPATNDQGRV